MSFGRGWSNVVGCWGLRTGSRSAAASLKLVGWGDAQAPQEVGLSQRGQSGKAKEVWALLLGAGSSGEGGQKTGPGRRAETPREFMLWRYPQCSFISEGSYQRKSCWCNRYFWRAPTGLSNCCQNQGLQKPSCFRSAYSVREREMGEQEGEVTHSCNAFLVWC